MAIDPTIVEALKPIAAKAKNVVVMTGAGISAESGIPTFRGAGGLWREFNATDLANPKAWERDPGLVWEFYVFVGLFFFIACFGMSRYSMYLERKLATDRR